MLFNSLTFIFGFLPLTVLATWLAGRWRQGAAKAILALASLAFYAVGRPRDLPLLLASLIVNYAIGALIQRAFAQGRQGAVRLWMWLGVGGNLAFLGWYKYADFIAQNLSAVLHTPTLPPIALPLAISFYTFVNIAYLIDSARGRAEAVGPLDFALLTTFFAKLISGPVVHSEEFTPQLQSGRFGRLAWRNILVGLVIFSIGLFKKTVLADSLAGYVNPLFDSARHGAHLDLLAGWTAAVGYTFQIYFDFSGYSDMAIGAARVFGLKLPINFHSPLRARSIVDFWRRWHMTLQRLIVSLVFDPLSMPLNRWAAARGLGAWGSFATTVSLPIFATFLAFGVWHGAGWTFVAFGALHGLYVSINEAWREHDRRRRRRLRRAGKELPAPGWPGHAVSCILTFAAVALANVMFRATSISVGLAVWRAMSGFGGLDLGHAALNVGLAVIVAASAAIVFLAPNTQQIMGRFDPAWNWRDWRATAPAPLSWTWKPSAAGLLFAGGAFFLGLMFTQAHQATFLYFQF